MDEGHCDSVSSSFIVVMKSFWFKFSHFELFSWRSEICCQIWWALNCLICCYFVVIAVSLTSQARAVLTHCLRSLCLEDVICHGRVRPVPSHTLVCRTCRWWHLLKENVTHVCVSSNSSVPILAPNTSHLQSSWKLCISQARFAWFLCCAQAIFSLIMHTKQAKVSIVPHSRSVNWSISSVVLFHTKRICLRKSYVTSISLFLTWYLESCRFRQ